MGALDLYAAAQRARAQHLAKLHQLVALAAHHEWAEEHDGWQCRRCDVSLSDLAPLDAAAKIVRQPCAAKGGATG